MLKSHRIVGAILALVLLVGVSAVGTGGASTGETKRYLVVFAGDYAVDGTYAVDGGYAVLCNYAVLNGYAVGCNYAVAYDYAVSLVEAAGGTVANDMLSQTGVLVVESSNALFADVMRTYAVVEEAAAEFVWQGVPAGADYAVGPDGSGGGGSEVGVDPLEIGQWSMMQIQAPEAHAIQAGWREVDVGILDTGIDGAHPDFRDGPNATGLSNVDCGRGRDFVPDGPGAGNPDPCIDNGFHGTHVAGIVAAQANDVGVVGVAPGVTLVPVKVCDTVGFCYSGATAAGITYAGDAQLDVVNMSFFVDDDTFLGSTEFKCANDPEQRAFRRANERALQYARSRGVTLVAALGNSDSDLSANSPCEVVPAESSGVIGTMALGRNSQKAGYSSYGNGATDVAAPGGAGTTGDCTRTVLSTFPTALGGYACIQGTSMASPHAAGVAALIVSQFGKLGSDNDVKMSPAQVEAYLQGSTIDIGLAGYDECFGHGRINALRAVQHTTSGLYDASAPFCPEYTE